MKRQEAYFFAILAIAVGLLLAGFYNLGSDGRESSGNGNPTDSDESRAFTDPVKVTLPPAVCADAGPVFDGPTPKLGIFVSGGQSLSECPGFAEPCNCTLDLDIRREGESRWKNHSSLNVTPSDYSFRDHVTSFWSFDGPWDVKKGGDSIEAYRVLANLECGSTYEVRAELEGRDDSFTNIGSGYLPCEKPSISWTIDVARFENRDRGCEEDIRLNVNATNTGEHPIQIHHLIIDLQGYDYDRWLSPHRVYHQNVEPGESVSLEEKITCLSRRTSGYDACLRYGWPGGDPVGLPLDMTCERLH